MKNLTKTKLVGADKRIKDRYEENTRKGNIEIWTRQIQLCKFAPKTELGGSGGQTAKQLSPPYLEHRKHGQQLMVIVVITIIISITSRMLSISITFHISATQIRAAEEDIEFYTTVSPAEFLRKTKFSVFTADFGTKKTSAPFYIPWYIVTGLFQSLCFEHTGRSLEIDPFWDEHHSQITFSKKNLVYLKI